MKKPGFGLLGKSVDELKLVDKTKLKKPRFKVGAAAYWGLEFGMRSGGYE